MRGDFCENARVHPKPLCILFFDTKGIQWVDTDATHVIPVDTEGDPLHFDVINTI